ncbi:hypothetical protein [Promicromonospora sp. NFX87]|uniref:hypothetical protein n=1 Tax=Promicromonospora sp. NFX87 TaxID=3402691 RepID=UPI003AFAAAE5
MDFTPQILANSGLMHAWAQGAHRILLDADRNARDRIKIGRRMIYLMALDPDNIAGIPEIGTAPEALPAELHECWQLAFSDDDADTDTDRLSAVLYVYGTLQMAAAALEGEKILYRELGSSTPTTGLLARQ